MLMVDYTGRQFGKYRLVRQLGHGGFATVYLGEHVDLGTQVAVKVLHLQRPQTEEERKEFLKICEKFLEEARTLASLDHPHIVRVLDYDVVTMGQENVSFLVMRYAPNGTLRQRHPEGEYVPLPTIVEYVKQLASALQYAHDLRPERERLVHRDVKPENMLVDRDGKILLSDFGIAVLAHTQMQTPENARDNVVGTPLYMAPEQFRGNPSARSDEYSLAIVVYGWLCGDPPFEGDYLQLEYQHRYTTPESPVVRNKSVPPGIAKVVMKALSKRREDRYRTVNEFATALEAAYKGWQRRWFVRGGAGVVGASVVGVGVFEAIHLHLLGLGLPGQGQAPTPTPTPPPPHQQGEMLASYAVHSMSANALAWSVDGRYLAFGSDVDDNVQIWSPPAQAVLQNPGYSAAVNAVGWSHDGRIAIGMEDSSIRVIDVTGKNRGSYLAPSAYGPVQSVAFSPDGAHLVVGYGYLTGTGGGELVVWDTSTSTGQAVNTVPTVRTITCVSWSPKGAQIVFGDRNGGLDVLQQYSDKTGNLTNVQHTAVTALAWSPDGTKIALANSNGVQVLAPPSPGSTFTELIAYPQSGARALAWSPDNAYIASGGAGKAVTVWNAHTQQVMYTYTRHTSQVNGLAWASNKLKDSLIASASSDNTVQVWYPFPS